MLDFGKVINHTQNLSDAILGLIPPEAIQAFKLQQSERELKNSVFRSRESLGHISNNSPRGS